MIKLSQQNGSWVAQHSNPQVKELFGSDTIPTAFRDTAPADTVRARIQELNPEEIVAIVLLPGIHKGIDGKDYYLPYSLQAY